MVGLFLSLMITGCGDVSTVKNGTSNFDNSITVGEAFAIGLEVIPNHKTITTPYIHSNSLQYNHNHKVV